MLNQESQNTFFFNEVLNKVCQEEIDDEVIKNLNFENLQKVWIAFVNHVFDEMKLNRRIKVFDFFIIGFSSNKKNIQIQFTKNWLNKNNLSQMLLENPPIIPIRRMFFENIQNFTDLSLNEVSLSIRSIFAYIENQILNSNENLEIELSYLGKIIKLGDIINFVELPQSLNNNKNQINTFQFLQLHQNSQKQNLNKGNQFHSNNIKKLNKKKLAPLKSFLCLDINENQNTIYNKKNLLRQKKVKLNLQSIINKLKPQQKTELATHPLSLNQNFSNLVNDPKILINTILQKPQKIKQPAPLIFDPYSHTKACPLNLQYNSFSISSRIAINYTPLSKYLYLDYETQKIIVLQNKENKALFLRQAPELKSDQKKTAEDLSKERYNQYIKQYIQDVQIIEFPQESFKKILNQDYNKYKQLSQDDIEYQKQKLKQEIQKDFNLAAKKVLLDYVLKEKEEKIRLGIEQIIDPIVEYGTGKYKFQMDLQPNTFMQRKAALQKNLILYQNTTHKIVDCWYCIKENSNFILRDLEDKGITLKDFQELQKKQMSNLRSSLCSVWVKEISQIYKKNLLNQQKKEIKKYFNCISNVISQQVRELVVNSIQDYLNFIKKFKKDKYYSVEECLLKNQNLQDSLQKSFLILQLKEQDNKIVFENSLNFVKDQLIQILKDGITNSDHIPRPENFSYRTDKNILHIIDINDEIVVQAIEQIEKIIDDNFQKIQRVNIIFKQFESLFTEGQKLDKILQNEKPDIKRYIQLYQKYNKLKDKIVEEVPLTIYMNLARIDCTDLKKKFLKIVKNLNQKIIDRAQEEISYLTKQIDQIRKKSLNQVSVQIDSVEKLIDAENNLNEYQNVSFIQIQQNFERVIKWYKDFYITTSQLNKEVYIDIKSTIQKIQTMDLEINKESKRIKSERERLEKNNRSDKETIGNLLKVCNNSIKEFKTKGKKYEMNNIIPKISNIVEKYQQGQKKIIIINKEEKLLGFSVSSFTEFKNVGESLNIFQELWKMIEDWEEKKKNWENSDIFTLNTEFMEKDVNEKLEKLEFIIKGFNKMNPVPEPPLHLTEELQKAVINFKEDIQLLKCLCAKGMEKRHWDQVNFILQQNKININIDSNNSYVIKTLRDSGIKEYTSDFQVISQFATQEYENKIILDKIEENLLQKKINLIPYDITESYVITMNQVLDIYQMFQKDNSQINEMKDQQHAAVHEDRIIQIKNKLKNTEEVFSDWIIVQNIWIHLEPIFNTEEYLEYLPIEYQKFSQLNQGYLKFIKDRNENKNLIDLYEYKLYSKKLNQLKINLKDIHRKLELFIFKQNQPFPKFYSTSFNSQIEINIVEQNKKIKKIETKKHIPKCKSFNN